MTKAITIIFSFVTIFCFGQDTDIVAKISRLQIKNDTFYHDGLFASQRVSRNGKNSKEDNTIFFTSLLVYTLQSLRDGFSDSDQKLADSIVARATKNYFRYRNRNDDITFNFWQTRPDQPFPNSKFLSKQEKMRLPDDLDDTSIIYLTKERDKSLDSALKQKMLKHVSNDRMKSVYKRYRKYHVYTTWFGEKMPQEMDVCVLSNALLFAFKSGGELNETDQQTLNLIKEIVIHDEHIKHPHIVSPSYSNSAIILYHVSRLMEVANNPVLNSIREKVISDLNSQLHHCKNEMEKVVLLTSLYRLGVRNSVTIDIARAERDFDTFYWFRANLSSGKNIFLKRVIGKRGLFKFNYTCAAYYWALVLESETLANNFVKFGE